MNHDTAISRPTGDSTQSTRSTLRQHFDVAVIGYGPVGATLAGLLGRAGRLMVVYLALGLVVAWMYQRLPTSFLPQQDQGTILVNMQLPPGATLARTQAVVEQVDDSLLTPPEVAGLGITRSVVSVLQPRVFGVGPGSVTSLGDLRRRGPTAGSAGAVAGEGTDWVAGRSGGVGGGLGGRGGSGGRGVGVSGGTGVSVGSGVAVSVGTGVLLGSGVLVGGAVGVKVGVGVGKGLSLQKKTSPGVCMLTGFCPSRMAYTMKV